MPSCGEHEVLRERVGRREVAAGRRVERGHARGVAVLEVDHLGPPVAVLNRTEGLEVGEVVDGPAVATAERTARIDRGRLGGEGGEQRIDVPDDAGLPGPGMPELEQVVGRTGDEPGRGRLHHRGLVLVEMPQRCARRPEAARQPGHGSHERGGDRPRDEPPT